MSDLNQNPIHKSLNRESLLFGAEREWVLISGLIAFSEVFISMSLVSAVLGIGLWSGAIMLLRQMAKADPKMSKLYMRYISYQTYYPAYSRPYR